MILELKVKVLFITMATLKLKKEFLLPVKKVINVLLGSYQQKRLKHNPKKEIINYKNALLKVYDIPVMYFPKFFILIQL